MKKMCELLGIRRLSVKELCQLGLLIAITVVLAIYATFRVGTTIKVPFKFISVFVTGALFGPIPAALTALLGDLLNTFLVPVGPSWIPGISLVEFISGFIFGVFFYNRFNFSKTYVVRLVLCVICQALLDIFVTPVFLVQAGIFPSYTFAIITRLGASALKMLAWSVVIFAGASYLPIFAKQVRG